MISTQHGRKRGWLLLQAYRAAMRVGALSGYLRPRWDEVERLVFVCKGNICRSAYAELRARSLGARAVSFGLATRAGALSPSLAVELARERGIPLGLHRARRPSEVPLGPGDLLLAMEPAQARRLEERAAALGAQVSLLGLWLAEPYPYLQDPYGLCREYHRVCFSRVDAAVAEIVRRAGGARERRGALADAWR